jgi:hypothetical protein
MRKASLLVLGGLVASAFAASCGSSDRSFFEAETGQPDAGQPPTGLGGEAGAPLVSAVLKGKTYAPNGTLPMGNTLIYVTSKAPEPIPAGAYCDECVTLPEGTFGSSSPDGTFEIPVEVPPGKSFLVVQKGQFRRVREIEVDEEGGVIELSKDDTTLPARSDPSRGDDVPRMLVVKDIYEFDEIDESLSKLGIQGVQVMNDRQVLNDLDRLMSYHVVFIPCGDNEDPLAQSPQVLDNLRAYAAAGGKLYVTDYSYEFVRQPFPGFITWQGESDSIGSATQSKWSAAASVTDPDLAAWLGATGDADFSVVGNYTSILGVDPQPGLDPKGEEIAITPKVWVSAERPTGTVPTTVSFEHQCGRVLFSTYHTENDFGPTLHAQEKALLYVLLEVGVCVGHTGVN